MKICIPTESKDEKKANVYGHFGSAPVFTIYDTENDSIEIIDNSNQHHSHGMCQPMNSLTDKKIDAVVCGGMGARAVQKLNQAGIKTFRALGGTVEQIIEKYKNGNLDEITVQNSCSHHSCS